MTNGVCAVRCESYDRVGGTDGWERIGRGKTARGASGVDVIKPSTVHKTSDDHDGDPSVNRYLSRPGPARQLTFRNRTEVNASHQIRFTQGYMRITRGHGASQRLYSTASSSTLDTHYYPDMSYLTPSSFTSSLQYIERIGQGAISGESQRQRYVFISLILLISW